MKKLASFEEFQEKYASVLGNITSVMSGGLEAAAGLIKKYPKALGIGVPAVLTTAAVADSMLDKPQQTWSYRMNKSFNGFMNRIEADETAGRAFATQLGKGAAKELIGLTKDMFSKGLDSVNNAMGANPARRAIFDALKQEDPIIAQAQDKDLIEAYHTMTKFAPKLSTDKNAVKSFLREAVVSGGGVGVQSVKLLAEAENAVQKQVEFSRAPQYK